MKTKQVYVIGSGPAPSWCRNLIMQYRKYGGETGYEFHGRVRDYDLEVGDRLIYKNGSITIERREAAQ